MSKPESVVVNYKLSGWSIDCSSGGFDIGDIGPDIVPFQVVVGWIADSDIVSPNKKYHNVEKKFRTIEEAKAYLLEETGVEL